jgi:oligoendopeptidase F
MSEAVLPRSAIPEQFTWDLASVFPSDQAWEQELNRVADSLAGLAHFQGRLGDNPQTLLEWFETLDALWGSVGKVYVYAGMQSDADTTDQAARAREDRANSLWARAQAATSFAEPEMLAVGLDRIRDWMDDAPKLAVYRQYFDQLARRQEHVRSAEVEELLGLASDPFATASATHRLLTDADLTFQPARTGSGDAMTVVQGNIGALLRHPDREVRRTAWESYADAHLAFQNTIANCLTAAVKQSVFDARVRRYGSALEASLATNHIPVSVFRTLVETFRSHLPTWHRYWSVLRQALGYEQLHVYDIKAPLVAEPPKISFDEAVNHVLDGLQPLGERYSQTARRGLTEQRWVDIYPNLGKTSGAYSGGWPGTHPFILMSHESSLQGLSTLAHELGHSMHSHLTWQAQPFIYSDYGLFVAEVASNVNQALVRNHLAATNPNPTFQIALIEEAMNNFHRYFFIMPTLARFELEIHERVERNQALSSDILNGLMTELFQEGYGTEVQIDAARIGSTWMHFSSHLYNHFYVYQYATGIAAAHALAEGILDRKPGAVDGYLAFLSAGSSLYPLDALRLAGVDMTSPEPVQKTFALLAQMIERLAALLEQRKVARSLRGRS